MRNYTTQMDAARQGIITPEMKAVAKKEYRTEEEIRELVAKGQVAICANKNHTCIDPVSYTHLEAFDGAEAKAMLTNLVLEVMPKKYLVAASGMAGLGSANTIKTRKVTNKFYLCGDEVSDVKDGIGLVSSRVMLCAAHQAHIVLRILAEEYEV